MQIGILERIGIAPAQSTKADRMRTIVARCQEGDEDGYRALFEECVDGVYRHLSLLLGPGADVDDLIQLVFLNVFNSLGRFRGRSAFTTWLFRITVNVARQEIRSRKRYRRLGTAVNDASKVQPQFVDYNPEQRLNIEQQIYEVLDQLTLKKRETFILYTYEGYSLEEIAELLGSSVSTVGSRLQSARREIVKILAKEKKQ
ncbi:MAG: RNA polymerase sigma factor [Myxococcota bacterium]|nr:RNA polymerase sigma factor [Myxococcota bacterium]